MHTYGDSTMPFSAVFSFQLLCVRSSTHNLHMPEMKLSLSLDTDWYLPASTFYNMITENYTSLLTIKWWNITPN